jgi:hypothetical protein
VSPGLGETPTLTQISEYASKIMAPTRDNRDDLTIFRASSVERDASFGARRARSSCRQVEVYSPARSSSRTSARFSASDMRRPAKGALRWRPPVEVTRRSTIRDARHVGAARLRPASARFLWRAGHDLAVLCGKPAKVFGVESRRTIGVETPRELVQPLVGAAEHIRKCGPVQALRRSSLAVVTIYAYVAAQSYHGRPH